MTLLIIILANFLTVVAALPYIRATAKGTTKPRVASWFGWGALTIVGSAAAFSQHQLPAAIFLAFCSLQNFSIVVLGLKHGDRKLTRLDFVAIIGAILGGTVLLLLKSPVLSTWVAITADGIVLLPTLKHTWQKPGEETVSTYVLEGIGCILILTLAGGFAFTAIAYPLYLLISNEVLTVLILKANRREQLSRLGSAGVPARGNSPTPGSTVLPDSKP